MKCQKTSSNQRKKVSRLDRGGRPLCNKKPESQTQLKTAVLGRLTFLASSVNASAQCIRIGELRRNPSQIKWCIFWEKQCKDKYCHELNDTSQDYSSKCIKISDSGIKKSGTCEKICKSNACFQISNATNIMGNAFIKTCVACVKITNG